MDTLALHFANHHVLPFDMLECLSFLWMSFEEHNHYAMSRLIIIWAIWWLTLG
jgi:hypothetical protein